MRKSLWLALVICAWLAAGRADAVVLRYNLKKGDTASYKEMESIAQRMSFSMAGQSRRQDSASTANSLYKEQVTDVTSEGVIILIRSTLSEELTTGVNGKEQKISQPPGEKTYIRMTPQGRVLSARTTVPQETSQSMSSRVPGTNMEDLLGGLGTLEAVTAHFPFPDKDLQPNETWTDTVRLPGFLGGASTTISLNSRLLAIAPYKGRDCVKIRTSFEIPLDIDMRQFLGQALPPGADVQMDMKGKITGRMEWQFDYKSGRLVYSEGPVVMSFNSSFSLTSPQGQSMPGELNLVMKINTKTFLLEK